MKTSNKLLIAIAALIILSLVSFDIALHAEYKKGDYSGRHYNEVSVPVKDFDTIEDYTTYTTFTDITSGQKQEIWVSKESQNDLVFTVENRVLKIRFKTIATDKNRVYTIHINCRRLNSLKMAMIRGDMAVQVGGNTTLAIINQDSIRIENNVPGIVNFTPVDVKKIDVTMNEGTLNIGGNGNVETANFNIHNKSYLTIGKIKMAKTTYNLDDSSQVTLPGAMWHKLSH